MYIVNHGKITHKRFIIFTISKKYNYINIAKPIHVNKIH